jgi:PKD repeat protein
MRSSNKNGEEKGEKMKKRQNLKKHVNFKKAVLIFSEFFVVFLILGSSITMADTGLSEQKKSVDVKENQVNQISSSQKPGFAPENPEFTEYEKKTLSAQNGLSMDGHSPGLIPTIVDFHSLGNISAAGISAPAYYDLRALNRVTTVKDQGSAGTCWIFASYASLESFLTPGENWDFSENNMKNLLTATSSEGFDYSLNQGGNHLMSTAYLARWSGPVAESEDPYSSTPGVSSQNLTKLKHVQDILFISDKTSSLDNEEIKWAVQNYGAVYSTMYYSTSYCSNDSFGYYYNGTYVSNHAVTIVGWDDSYDKNKFKMIPPGNGAFIVKNSWSTGWGDQGYFYVSYYDSNLGKYNSVFTAEDTNNYENIYQYDPFGWVTSFGYGSPTCWCANIFTAKSDENLEAVSFYTKKSNCNYEIYIYTNTESSPISQEGPALYQSGIISTAGYHTVHLNSGVQINAGKKFSVVLKLTTPDYSYPIAIEYPWPGYSSKAKANAGESFVSSDGATWTDITTLYSNTNVCLKAFTNLGAKLPVADFLASPTSGNLPLKVTFTDQSTGSPFSWSWNFGDGTDSTEQNPKHTYTSAGTYTVNLVVSNANGTNSKLTTITVLSQPVIPVADFKCDVTQGYTPLSVMFTDLSRNTVQWNWNFGDGTYSTEQNPMHTYTSAGTYTINLVVSNANGTNSKLATITVLSQPILPVANFSCNVTKGYVPLFVQFTDRSQNAAQWKWDFGDGANSTEQNPMHTYSAIGNYTVNLTVIGLNGTNSKLSTINVSAKPVLPIANFSSNITNGSAPLSVQFIDLSKNATGWNWNFGDGVYSTEKNPTHTYSSARTYTVSLTVTNADGSNNTKKSNYIVASVARPPVASYSSNVKSGYSPLSVAFTDKSTRSPTSWSWDFGDKAYSTEQNPVHVYNKTGKYTVTLKVSNTAGSNTMRKTSYITVTAPKLPVAAFIANKVSGKAPLTVTFTDRSSGSPTTWNWNFGDGSYSMSSNPMHVYSKAGKYTVSFTVTNANGNSTTTKTGHISVSK